MENYTNWGPLIISIYFCTLFSRHGVQRGGDSVGLFGFLLGDIKRELCRGKKLLCNYCGKPNATLECQFKGCKVKFHFPCGRENNASNIFVNSMDSFCSHHLPKQKPVKIKPNKQDLICLAGCQERIKLPSKIKLQERYLLSPCCGRFYHCECLQLMALSSGEAHFKCPICSDKDEFKKVALQVGIYIPVQDASWEKPENENFYGYVEMGRIIRHCDAKRCLCKESKKRSHHLPGTMFEIIRCNYCGSSGVHLECAGLAKYSSTYICPKCNVANADEGEEQDRMRIVNSQTPPLPSPASSSTSPKRIKDNEIVILDESSDDEEIDVEVIHQNIVQTLQNTEPFNSRIPTYQEKPLLSVFNPITNRQNEPIKTGSLIPGLFNIKQWSISSTAISTITFDDDDEQENLQFPSFPKHDPLLLSNIDPSSFTSTIVDFDRITSLNLLDDDASTSSGPSKNHTTIKTSTVANNDSDSDSDIEVLQITSS